MIKTYKEKKAANVQFSCENLYIPALDRTIEFTSAAGAKKSFINLVRKHIGNLRRFYGTNKKISASVTVKGCDIPIIESTFTI